MTSGNAGHRHIRGRSKRPHNGWRPPHCASSAAWTIPPHPLTAPLVRAAPPRAEPLRAYGRQLPGERQVGRRLPGGPRQAPGAGDPGRLGGLCGPHAAPPQRQHERPGMPARLHPGRTGLRPGPATRPAPPANRQAIRRAALAAPRASPGSRCASPIPVAWSGSWRRLAGLVEAEMAHHWFIRLLRCLLRSRRRRLQPPAWGEWSRTAVSGLACRACGRPPAGRTG